MSNEILLRTRNVLADTIRVNRRCQEARAALEGAEHSWHEAMEEREELLRELDGLQRQLESEAKSPAPGPQPGRKPRHPDDAFRILNRSFNQTERKRLARTWREPIAGGPAA